MRSFAKTPRTMWLAALLLPTTLACSSSGGGDASGGRTLSGDWVATTGERGVLTIQQTGLSFTGKSCEAENTDCYDIDDGVISVNKLTFSYGFEEAGVAHTVDGSFTVDGAGTTLTGELFATKCNCNLPHVYVRQ